MNKSQELLRLLDEAYGFGSGVENLLDKNGYKVSKHRGIGDMDFSNGTKTIALDLRMKGMTDEWRAKVDGDEIETGTEADCEAAILQALKGMGLK